MQWCKMRENNRVGETINGEKKRERKEREQRRERNTKFNRKRQKSRRMDFSRPIERGDGNCAVSIPFVRRVIRYEMKRWTKEGVKKKEKRKKGRGNCARIVSYFWNKRWLIPCQRIRISKRIRPADPPISRVIVESQTQTPIHSARGWRRLYIYIYIYLYPRSKFQAWKKRKEKKRGKGKKKSSFPSSLWPLGNIHGFILNGLKVLESAKVDKER